MLNVSEQLGTQAVEEQRLNEDEEEEQPIKQVQPKEIEGKIQGQSYQLPMIYDNSDKDRSNEETEELIDDEILLLNAYTEDIQKTIEQK
jgi:hypothetical protein